MDSDSSAPSYSGLKLDLDQLTLFQNFNNEKIVTTAEHYTHKHVLILYTGGTLGMKKEDGSYKPVANYLGEYMSQMTEFQNPKIPKYTLVEYDPILDSSDMDHDHWIKIARDIEKNYYDYDGFVIIHGTDTMAYSASMLSFMLQNLGKPIVYTGANIPISELFSDGRRNMVVSMVIAAYSDIPEVCIFFDLKLLRANRATKSSAWGMSAFSSGYFPPLATLGLQISMNRNLTSQQPKGRLRVLTKLSRNVAVVRLTPGLNVEILRNLLRPPLKGLVLQAFGTGNAPQKKEFYEVLEEANQRGVVIVVITQCVTGMVDLLQYAASLGKVSVINGYDMTTEAAYTKLCFLLGNIGDAASELQAVRYLLSKNLRGELSRNMKPFYSQMMEESGVNKQVKSKL